MTDNPSGIEWFLARDGQQYGPLSETEMRAFVDLGHLRPSDLVWRVGFPEWRAAPEVFALLAQSAPPAPPPPIEQAMGPQPVDVQPQHHFAPAEAAPHAMAAPTPDAIAATHAHPAFAEAAAGPMSPGGQPAHFQHAPRAEMPGHLFQGGATASAGPISDGYPAGPGTAPANHNPGSAARRGALDPRQKPRQQAEAPVPARSRRQAEYDDDDSYDDEPMARPRGYRRAMAALLLVVLVAVAALAFVMKEQLVSALSMGVRQLASSTGGVADTVRATAAAPTPTPLAISAGSTEAVDSSLQKVAIWRQVKAEFPEWYGDRLQETVKFAAEKRGDKAIAKHLVDSLVTLRRKHADQALAASPDRLKFVATAFLDNLQALSKQSVDTCYGFISQGETFPAIQEMLVQPDVPQGLAKQVAAVFAAISDGRKAPQSYMPPRKADYDALAAELNARGWSEADLRTFSDPRALGRATPQQVCKMVQDWFSAQIAIKDPETQLRLLVESLRPVVAG